MIEFKTGDIFSAETEAIVNTVNCVGVMGRGLALQFKNRFPENFKDYKEACVKKIVQPGKMLIYKTNGLLNPKYIINFPTKRHWKANSKMEDIQAGLIDLKQVIKKYNIQSIAIPPLGSGLGKLSWKDVKAEIIQQLGSEDCRILVYEPLEQIITKPIIQSAPKMTSGRAALIGLIDNYLKGLMTPVITLLEVHKLMYFLQEAGEPLNLKFKKAPYGPYASNLKQVLNRIEGHFILGYEDDGDAPDKQIKLVNNITSFAQKKLSSQAETEDNFKKVVNLIEGFESPFGLELLATVHWVMKYEHKTDIPSVIASVHNWNERKKQFTNKQIELAMQTLSKDLMEK